MPDPPSSPLSPPPASLPDLSPSRQGELTPSLIDKSTPHDTSGASPHNADALPKKGRTGSANTTPAVDKLYPPGLPRLTRFGKGTYGINTGPLGDDTDWDTLSIPAIREQLKMRNVNYLGAKAAILDRIKNWREHIGKDDQETMNLPHTPAFKFDPSENGAASAPGRGIKWKTGTTEGTVTASAKALKETMYLLKREDLNWGDGMNDGMIEQAEFTLLTSTNNQYHVEIGKRCKCDCPSKKFHPQEHCKHILYVFIRILHAPEVLIQQQGLTPHEVNLLLTHGPKLRPSQADIDADATMKDGVPKDKKGCDCSLCFRSMDDEQTVCCDACGRSAHNNCFVVWANVSTWSIACPTCKSNWTKPVPRKIGEPELEKMKKRGPRVKAEEVKVDGADDVEMS